MSLDKDFNKLVLYCRMCLRESWHIYDKTFIDPIEVISECAIRFHDEGKEYSIEQAKIYCNRIISLEWYRKLRSQPRDLKRLRERQKSWRKENSDNLSDYYIRHLLNNRGIECTDENINSKRNEVRLIREGEVFLFFKKLE